MQQTKIELDILEAAKALFFEKGFTATSTTDIARRVGCNQALVHYYYRTKENLFQQIFITEVNKTLTVVSAALDNPAGISLEGPVPESIINAVIDSYFQALIANPKLPFFLVNEMLVNPDRRAFIRENFIKNPLRAEAYEKYSLLVRGAVEKGTIRPIEPFDLLLDIVSLTAATFLSLPLYSDLLDRTPAETDAFLDQRKQEIKTLLLARLKA